VVKLKIVIFALLFFLLFGCIAQSEENHFYILLDEIKTAYSKGDIVSVKRLLSLAFMTVDEKSNEGLTKKIQSIIGQINNNEFSNTSTLITGKPAPHPTLPPEEKAVSVQQENQIENQYNKQYFGEYDGYLYNEGGIRVAVAINLDVYEQMEEALIHNDKVLLGMLATNNLIFAVDNRTKVRRLDVGILKQYIKIRILEGKYAGMVGYTINVFFVEKNQ